jgi:quercetin dioxygenase-like cupin family protein
MGDQVVLIGPGDIFVIPALAIHSCRALEAGILIDSFTPRRNDFL